MPRGVMGGTVWSCLRGESGREHDCRMAAVSTAHLSGGGGGPTPLETVRCYFMVST